MAAADKTAKTDKTAAKPPAKKWDAKLSHKVRHTVITIVLTLLVIGGGAYGYYFISQDTQAEIRNGSGEGTTRIITAETAAKANFDEAFFSFSLPGDWKRLPPDLSGPYKKYSYQSGLKNAENRYLQIYADGIPLDKAVNKAVAVRSEGATLTHGEVSTNCTEFTAPAVPKRLAVPAKWDGVDFLCDMDVTTRNVVGTSSPGAINRVELTNVGFTKHNFFFVYEDNNNTPEYNIFYDMLESFTVK